MGRVALAPSDVLLDKYRIERVLGKGGMGTVVCARHISLDEVVAIKVLNDDIGLTDELALRFMREARAAAKLKSPHVVRVTDVGQLHDGGPYMVMEMLEGADLGQIVAEHGALDPAFAVGLVLQVCEVLAEAHAAGIVHRDIKPSNLFIITGDNGAPFVKLLDFGIAKVADVDSVQLTRTSSMLGTPCYMAPEQLRSSRSVDHRADLWAVGCVLYELLEGTRPFTAPDLPELILQIAINPAPPLVKAPRRLAEIVRRCLEKEPEGRFASADELAHALVPFAADPGSAARDLERVQRRANAQPDVAVAATIATGAPRAVARVAVADPEPRGHGRRVTFVVGGALLAVAAAVVVTLQIRPGATSAVSQPAPPLTQAPPATAPTPPSPVATELAEPKPAEAKPAEPKPAEPKPAELKPAELVNNGSTAIEPAQHVKHHTQGATHKKHVDPPPSASRPLPAEGSTAKPAGGSATPCDPYSRLGC